MLANDVDPAVAWQIGIAIYQRSPFGCGRIPISWNLPPTAN
jgi:hypothetical protein